MDSMEALKSRFESTRGTKRKKKYRTGRPGNFRQKLNFVPQELREAILSMKSEKDAVIGRLEEQLRLSEERATTNLLEQENVCVFASCRFLLT